MLLDEIPEGLWEVDFFENSSRRKSYNTGGSWPTWEDRHGIVRYGFWEVRIWILGMWMVPYPVLILAATSNKKRKQEKKNKIYIYIYIRLASRFPKTNPIYIYIYIYQSEGFPRTGYFIPAHVGAGAGQIWAFFRRRIPGPFLANLAHV